MKIHTLLASAILASAAFAAGPAFTIDATRPGRALPNVQQTLVVWHLDRNSFGPAKRNREHDVLEFAEYVEVMGATGGNPQRDCLRNPADRSVLDDYDFSRLVNGCRGIVSMGLKPYLKLGNVPQKFSTDNNPGSFHMNIRPPDDYAAYGRYMTACAKALLDAFGREELLKWRFAVLTEFENGGWFKDASGDAEKTFHAYCRLYETTVDAFTRTISPDLTFGVQSSPRGTPFHATSPVCARRRRPPDSPTSSTRWTRAGSCTGRRAKRRVTTSRCASWAIRTRPHMTRGS